MIRFKTDFGNCDVVLSNLKRRGWEHIPTSDLDDDWDLHWASTSTIKELAFHRLGPSQRVNHFPNHYELTRKDLMVKNIRRAQRNAKRDGTAMGYTESELDIIPTTFVLPADYALFVEEFKKGNGTNLWIMKPSSKSQGKGIFLINKLAQIKQWSVSSLLPPSLRANSSTEQYVVSRYVENPLLIDGKKFDMRIYVCVTSFKPLQVYMSSLGFCRFCNLRYNPKGDLDNSYVHLTNVAIQKKGDDYNDKHGNKWGLDLLRLYLEGTRGTAAVDSLFREIENVIIKSLRSCQSIIMSDKHCFELYGFDLLIDSDLKPWLIEVNASPSLTTTTAQDHLLKFRLINDTLNLITPLSWLSMTRGTGAPTSQLPTYSNLRAISPREQVGSFRLIFDELRDDIVARAIQEKEREVGAEARGSRSASAARARRAWG
jgi:tubulin polyglutamylase TTLL1